MIPSALDEVLFWQEPYLVIQKVQELLAKFYPHDPAQYFAEKDRFYQESIGSKAEFCRRLALYRDQGSTEWVASRTRYMDDLSAAGLKKACQNATREEAAARVARTKSGIDKKCAALFSVICSRNGIDECREIPSILHEASRVLRPGGKKNSFKKYHMDVAFDTKMQ